MRVFCECTSVLNRFQRDTRNFRNIGDNSDIVRKIVTARLFDRSVFCPNWFWGNASDAPNGGPDPQDDQARRRLDTAKDAPNGIDSEADLDWKSFG